ncbi:MAG: PAS domain-containing protein, partial [Thermoleophilia bacterium]|nr:PAS domain-containing protein [Thermoleophilia bacterium]
ACHCEPVLGPDGRPLAALLLGFDEPRVAFDWERRLEAFGARVAALAIERDRTTRAVQEGKARLSRIVEGARDYAIIELDADGAVVYWNSGAERLLGWAEAEILGRSGRIFFTPEDRAADAPERELERARDTGRAENERWHLRKDGSRFWGSGLVMRLTGDPGGPASGFVKVVQDRTAHRAIEEALQVSEAQAKQSLELLDTVVDRCPFGIYLIDSDLRIISVNRGSQDGAFANVRPLIGRPLAEAMGIIWPAPVADEVVAAFRRTLETGEPYLSQDFVNPRADTDQVEGYEWELHRVTLPDGRPGVACYYYDSTRLRAAQAALREADRRKDEFLAMLAHELRNPLAAVGNAATVLKMSDDPENIGFAKDVIERQTRQLARLIDDLLDVSRITSGKIRLRTMPCDAGIILRQAVESVAPIVEERKHTLITDIEDAPLPLVADPTRVEQIVVNLLTNAAKYTENGGRIRLSARRDGGQVVIAVEDDGMGIAPEKLPQMFELFTQGERSIARSEGGLGIGLTIVQKLTEMHGGRVAAASEGPRRGSTFTVRLPAAPVPAAPPLDAAGAAPVREARRSRILVVDDNEDTAVGLARLLELLGNEVAVAHDGPNALEKARSFRPTYILLDIGLPGMDGYEVARRLRRDPDGPRPVIVAVSGYGQDEDR